jgi:hypothetical protein
MKAPFIMSDKLRSVNTRFWEDPFIESLSPTEKLLFIYLLTNPLTNLIGIYEITIKRISYDTGITKENVEKGLKGFERVRKAFFIENFIVLPNFLKNQSLNENMKVGVIKLFKSLPIILKNRLLGNDYQTLQNDYQTLRNGLLKLKLNNESEKEIESEGLKDQPDFINQIIDCFVKEHGSYEIITPGKEREMAGKILNIYKKKYPDANSKETLEGLRLYFKMCVNISDTWLRNNMSLSMIVSKFNEINKILNNGINKSGGATNKELAELLAHKLGIQ